jgi:cytochrome c peroxidase
MKLRYKVIFIISISISIYACTKKQDEITTAPSGTPSGPALPAEPYNYLANAQFIGGAQNLDFTNNSATLGRVLFYDKALSFNGNMSCGSCHFQDKGFADNVRFNKGVFGNVLKRNTLSITGNNFLMFWDGRSSGMQDLVLRPVANHDEMVQDPIALVNKIKQFPYYQDLFKKAYGSEEITLEGIENALASFCVCIVPVSTKFDKGLSTLTSQFSFTFIDSTTSLFNFNTAENKGMSLFYGKARCSSCHHPEIITGYYGGSPYANIGLDIVYNDNGLGALANDGNQNGKFKIPNIRNVALTAPYMHDGRFNTLEEVVDHYNTSIKPNRNLSPRLYQNRLSDLDLFLIEEQNQGPSTVAITPVKLGLNLDEKAALVAFLKTLTDEEMKRDIKFSNPF